MGPLAWLAPPTITSLVSVLIRLVHLRPLRRVGLVLDTFASVVPFIPVLRRWRRLMAGMSLPVPVKSGLRRMMLRSAMIVSAEIMLGIHYV